MNNRHYYHITVARGMSIILVAFGHAKFPEINELIARSLGVVRMPFFFLLTGLFFSDSKSWSSYASLKASALLKPYFFVLSLIGLKQWLGGGDALIYFQGVFYGNGQTVAWTPLWFLPHLFLIYMLSGFVFRNYPLRNKPLWLQLFLVIFLLLIGGWALNYLRVNLFDISTNRLLRTGLPWGGDFLLISFGFFVIGYIGRQFFLNMVFDFHWLVLSVVLLLAMVYLSDARLDFNLRVYNPYWYLPIISLTGCVMLLQLAIVFSGVGLINTAFVVCGKYSLYILIFHVFIQSKLNGVFLGAGYSGGVFILFLSVFIPVVFGVFVRRFSWLRFWFEPVSSVKRMPVQ